MASVDECGAEDSHPDAAPSSADPPEQSSKDFALCPSCKVNYRYHDDSHSDCMRCRGPKHLCSLCVTMGPKSKERFLEWARKGESSSKSKKGKSQGNSGGESSQPTPQPQSLTQSDLLTFGKVLSESMASSMKSIFENFNPLLTPQQSSGLGTPPGESSAGSWHRTAGHSAPPGESTVGPTSTPTSSHRSPSGELSTGSLPPSAKAGGSSGPKGGSRSVRLALHDLPSTPPGPSQVELECDTPEDPTLLGPDDDDDDGSVKSLRTWDNKRNKGLIDEDEEDMESVLDPEDKVEGAPLSAGETEKYVNTLTKVIEALEISDAKVENKSAGRIKSSRSKLHTPKALLPLDESHKETIDRIWKSNVADISTYKKVTRSRYKIVEDDYNKYMKYAEITDEHLVIELERSGVKVQVKKPKIPDKDLSHIEVRAKNIEMQSQLGMACAVTQSWFLQYLSEQIEKVECVLRAGLNPDDYKVISDQVDFKTMREVSSLAQDACMDQLDLQAREAANSKGIRRSLWLDQTKLNPAVKTKLKRQPTVGDGTLCGPQLKSVLEAYRLTLKALDASETGHVSKSSGNPNKRPRGGGRGGGPPAKLMRLNFGRMGQFGRGRGGLRGFGRGGSSGARGGRGGGRPNLGAGAGEQGSLRG